MADNLGLVLNIRNNNNSEGRVYQLKHTNAKDRHWICQRENNVKLPAKKALVFVPMKVPNQTDFNIHSSSSYLLAFGCAARLAVQFFTCDCHKSYERFRIGLACWYWCFSYFVIPLSIIKGIKTLKPGY
ncbi:hypothetical protein T11_17329 [Trichinella zimbabwensis]|uniref:Uncharacterized protein n=1 Tax=Trichinella zimbabwensis TaxID=268475 RepID=A0A0V1GVD3_9BILA|nr:hypothetical protein T11_17329 [Trichinella zimbabwensis]